MLPCLGGLVLGECSLTTIHVLCAGSDAWRLHASAVDAWSFGIMLLELAAGNLYSWVAPLGKIAFQSGRLDAAAPVSPDTLLTDNDGDSRYRT